MNVTGIRASESLYSFQPTQSRTAVRVSEAASRNSGPDTALFSAEARALAYGTAAESGEEGAAGLMEAVKNNDTANTSLASLKGQGISLFAMMLETLFLADLEENEQTAGTGEQNLPEKKSTPLEETGKAKEIKKLMTDVANGKADLSDLPKAMAAKSSGSGGADGRNPASKAAETDPGAFV